MINLTLRLGHSVVTSFRYRIYMKTALFTPTDLFKRVSFELKKNPNRCQESINPD